MQTAPEIDIIARCLENEPRVRLAYVYGSLATGRARADSDADVAVLADRPLAAEQHIELVEQLAEACGRPIDLVDLSVAGEPLLGEILRDGIRLKGSSEDHAAMMVRHVFETEDFLPLVRRMLKERRQSWTR